MDFVNTTDLNARFLNTVISEDRMLGAVIVRPTYRLRGTLLDHLPEEPFPIEMAPIRTLFGEFPGDTPFLNGGVDVFVVGRAYHPDGRTGTDVRVDIRVGPKFHRAIRVVGNRRWVRQGKTLVASEPEPFANMPLTYANAFGGKVALEGGELAYPANPEGKGFVLEEKGAEGKPLPNLEDPDRPITGYADKPEPVGTGPYPQTGSLRALNAVVMRPDKQAMERIKPLFFNAAHPRMIIPAADAPAPGDTVEVTNVRPEGRLRFALPSVPLHAHVQLENRNYVCPLHLDQIGVIAEESRVFLSYRACFKYRVVEYERRVTTLHAGALPAEVPAEYVATWTD